MTDSPPPQKPKGQDPPDKTDPWEALERGLSQPAESQAWTLAQSDSPPLQDPTPISTAEEGRYAKGALLGEGGMGRVWSTQDHRLQRSVALKELSPTSPEHASMRARLAREAWITAQLEHPSIVPVYDAGQRSDGSLFYIMRMVRGRSLQETLEGLPLDGRLLLLRRFLDVCEAIAFAHSIGIVHRDLKPQNIMLGEFGETYVVDWGLARPLEGPEWTRQESVAEMGVDMTLLGDVVGTPLYMSPEQALGQPATRRSDIWGLGVILHVLLTGTTPRVGSAPLTLSDFEAHNPDIPAELTTIARCALHPDPQSRYPSAKTLAEDISAWLDGRRVGIHDYSRWELLRRFVSAWRVPLLVAFVSVLVLCTVVALAFDSISREKTRASEAQRDAVASLALADGNLAEALIEQALSLSGEGSRPEAETLAAHALRLKASPEARGVLSAFSVSERPERLHLIEAEQLPACKAKRLSSGGARLLCINIDETSLWRLEPLERLWSTSEEVLEGVVLDGTDRVWLFTDQFKNMLLDASTGKMLAEHEPIHEGRKSFLIFGDTALIRGTPPEVVVYDSIANTRTIKKRCATHQHAPAVALGQTGTREIQFCNDDRRFVITSDSGETRTLPLPELTSGLTALSLSPDGAWVAGGNTQGELVLVNLASGELTRRVVTDLGAISTLEFTADGAQVVVSGVRGGIWVWSAVSGAVVTRLPLFVGKRFRLIDGGRQMITLGRTIQRWRLPTAPLPHTFAEVGAKTVGLASASLSPDGERIVANRGDGDVMVFDVRDASIIARADLSPSHDAPIKQGSFSLDGQRYTSVSASHSTPVLDTQHWRPIKNQSTHIGRGHATLAGGHAIHVSYRPSSPITSPNGVQNVEWSLLNVGMGTNRRWAALLGAHLPQKIARVHAGTHLNLQDVSETRQSTSAVDITSDGQFIALGQVNTVRIIEVGSDPAPSALGSREVHVMDTPGLQLDVAFSPDGRRVASGGLDGSIRVWATDSGALLAVLRGHTLRVPWIEFDADGETLFSASWDGRIRRWNMRALETPPEQLIKDIERAWGLSQDQALRRSRGQ